MKSVISGLTYNTKTSTELASYHNALGRADYRYCVETLYRTQNGRFFLYGIGGPASKWARRLGDCRVEGERIVPLSEEEALEWCERREIDDVDKLFPELVKDA